jgi:hypothetical protein
MTLSKGPGNPVDRGHALRSYPLLMHLIQLISLPRDRMGAKVYGLSS